MEGGSQGVDDEFDLRCTVETNYLAHKQQFTHRCNTEKARGIFSTSVSCYFKTKHYNKI